MLPMIPQEGVDARKVEMRSDFSKDVLRPWSVMGPVLVSR